MSSEPRSADEATPAPPREARSLILRSLQAENQPWLVAGWGALLLIVGGILFSPLYMPMAASTADGQPAFDELSPAEKQIVAAPTAPESKRISELTLVREPLTPTAPPPQSGQAAPVSELFGVSAEHVQDFARLTASLRQSEADCEKWMGTSVAGGQAPASLTDAQTALDAAAGAATKERAVFHYHQGLIQLCGPNGPSSAGEFQAAQAAYTDYAKQHGGRDTVAKPDSQRLAQYETVTAYGLGLAQLAGLPAGKRPDDADKTFQDALSLAGRIRSYAPPGPFVRLTGCGTSGRGCDLFQFSTASIYNARLYAWLTAGQPKVGYERTKALASAPTYVAADPGLTANFAAAAAAAGEFGAVRKLFQVVRSDLANNGAASRAWRDAPEALARLTALATMAGEFGYDAGDDWWPQTAAVSQARQRFEASLGRGPEWFPPIALKSPLDRDSVDLWLWLNRERTLLSKGAFSEFRQDRATIASLPPADQDFVRRWRETVTGELGSALMQRADLVRRNDGMKAAAPLLKVIASGDFPIRYQWMAKLTLASGKPVGSVLLGDGIILVLIALLFLVHFDLNIGHSRTFTRRHFLHRTKVESAGGKRVRGGAPP